MECTPGGSHSSLADGGPTPSPQRFGNYLLLNKIASGGMGVVYRARQLQLNRDVALKMILAGETAGETERRRFLNEAEAVAGLNHPHIVPLLEVGEHEGRLYFTMRLIEGGSLATRIAKFKDDPRAAAEVLAKVAEAVHHAHERGILHRDLKPSNILLGTNSEPYVTDFGLAKLMSRNSELTMSGAVIGTPNYMAPELARGDGRQFTTAGDVFSLGAILYHLLTGHPPFRAETPLATLQQVLEVDPPTPGSLNRGVDRDLGTICLKCLEKDPKRRYGSALALAEDLRRWLHHEPIRARPTATHERLVKWARRRPASAAAAGFAALSLLGFSVTMAINQGRLQRERDATEIQLADSLVREGQALTANRRFDEAKRQVLRALNILSNKNVPTLSANLALLDLYRLSPPALLTLSGHQGPATSLAAGWDGKTLYSGGQDGTIRVWSLPLGREEAVLEAHAGGVTTLAMSPDGALMVSGGADRKVKVWDPRRLTLVKTLEGHAQSIKAVCFSPEGGHFASASLDASIRIWRKSDMVCDQEVPTSQSDITGIAFTQAERWIAVTSSDSALKMWELDAPEPLKPKDFPSAGDCLSVVCPPGRMQVLYGNSRGIISTLDFRPSEAITAVQRAWTWGWPITALASSANGRLAAAGTKDGSVLTWDSSDTSETPHFLHSHHGAAVASVVFLGGDGFLASAANDGTIKVWNASTQHEVPAFLGHGHSICGVDISPDDRLMLSASVDGDLKLWDIATRRKVRSYEAHAGWVLGGVISPDGSRMASAGQDGTVRAWDVPSGRETWRFDSTNRAFQCVAYSPDGRLMAAGEGMGIQAKMGTTPKGSGEQTRIYVFNALTGALVQSLEGHTNGVLALSFSNDGKKLLTGGRDGRLRIRDTATWQEVASIEADMHGINSAVLTRDGAHCFSAGGSGGLVLWDVASGRVVRAFAGVDLEATAVALSPDGATLFAGMKRGDLRVYDGVSGQERHTFSLSTVAVRSVAFTRNGRMAVSGSDSSPRLWDLDRALLSCRLELAAQKALGILRSSPQSPAALKDLATWYEFQNAWEWAERVYQQAHENGAVINALTRARNHWLAGNLDQAREQMIAAIQKKEAPDYYLELCLNAINCEIADLPPTKKTLAVPPDAVVLQPGPEAGKDIWTTSDYAGTPRNEYEHGNGSGSDDDTLRVGGWGDEYRSLLQFELSGAPTNAASATLFLFCRNTVGRRLAMHLDYLTNSWEWRLKEPVQGRRHFWWSERPSFDEKAHVALPPPKHGHWYSVDVTDLYNAWQSGTLSNHGLQLRPVDHPNGAFNLFHSSRYTNEPGLGPALVILPRTKAE